ncbi:MAG: PD-(D/E)XK nuclease family protein [Candidatus Moranbacteria bacterium]|nr:PD-(D/E)XK nuclease family protein [Candidatus Moranbacteria bacterium]
MKNNNPIRLSPTTGLNLFAECPRCFWLHYNKGVHRPRGIFPSLPSGMDLVIKDYFDQYRGSLPPELSGKVEGVLMPDKKLMNRWRNWRTGLEYRDEKLNAVLFGAMDDCLLEDGKYIPLDYKTRGSSPKDGDSERYYRLQLSSYLLLLQSNGFPVGEEAYLVYYYPQKVESGGIVKFNVKPVRIAASAELAKETFESAVKFLQGPLPKHHSSCEYCCWNKDLLEFD